MSYHVPFLKICAHTHKANINRCGQRCICKEPTNSIVEDPRPGSQDPQYWDRYCQWWLITQLKQDGGQLSQCNCSVALGTETCEQTSSHCKRPTCETLADTLHGPSIRTYENPCQSPVEVSSLPPVSPVSFEVPIVADLSRDSFTERA